MPRNVVPKHTHTPNADDGNCTTAITCSECQVIMTEVKVHVSSENWNKDETNHWKACTNEGCTTVTVEKINHTPNADDGNCTTADTCSVCQEVFSAKAHVPNANWSKDESSHWKECANGGCTIVVVANASHTMKNGSNVCECGNIVDLSMFTITDGLLSKCIPGVYTSLTIPNSVTSIGDGAFWDCSGLTSIDIPNSVTSIGEVAFYGCNGLTSITLAEGNTKYHSAGNCIIETATKTLTLGFKSSVIPTDGSVTSIGFGAFAGCSELTGISIPEGVTVISDGAFDRCTGLTNITIPESVTSIGEFAFYGCSDLTRITIGNNVTSIGYGAFKECSKLTSISIPSSVTSIGDYAFDECSKLTSITYNGTTAQWTDITKEIYWYSYGGSCTIICTDGTLTKAQSQN